VQVFQFAFFCFAVSFQRLFGSQAVEKLMGADGCAFGQQFRVTAEQRQKGIDFAFRCLS
jgi:hypothetical protein